MSFKPVVHVQGEWASNALRLATEAEARENAENLRMRWWLVDDVRVEPSDDPVNYQWKDGDLVAVKEAQ